MPIPEDKAALVPSLAKGDKPSGVQSVPLATQPGLLLWLAILFAGSGCAALIYEIVWFQMLQLVIGSTAVCLGALLASFMGGMCLGSVLLPRYIGHSVPPLRTWAFLELSIGAFGLAVLWAVPFLARVYAAATPGGLAGVLLRGTLCAMCLLPPTLLMGATLPVIARLTETTRIGASQIGLLYGANTLGAVVGALLAGFYLLRVSDVYAATYVAVAINGIIALAGLNLNGRTKNPASENVGQREPRKLSVTHWSVYVAIALSGLCALGAEVVWTRLLALMLGGTTYTFSIILAVFLLGIGIGGAAGGLLARWLRVPGFGFGLCQLLLVPAVAWTAFMLAKSLPYWPVDPSLARSIWLTFQIDLIRCLYAILPAACLWGASFPLALAAIAAPGFDSGRSVGGLYAANTLGAIIGAIGFSVILIPWLGPQQTQRLLIGLCALGGMVAFVGQWLAGQPGNASVGGAMRITPTLRRLALSVVVSAIAALLVWSVPRIPWQLVAYGRFLPTRTGFGTLLYEGEGMNASVAVTALDTGVKNFHISGKVEASTDPQDMRLQRMLGNLPALFHPDPHSVLVVGCGAGVTAGSFLTHPGIERVSLCEIEPLIPKRVAGYFSQENYGVVQDPRVRLIYDDARHYVLTTHDKFDIITSDPIHPWVKGAATLYTREYFELCKRHLNWGGMMSQWVPLYESNLATVKSEIATFFDVFPEGTLWSNDESGAGYDLVLLGQEGPLEVDVDTLQQRLRRADHRRVLQSLREVGIRTAFSLVATYGGQARDLQPWFKHAQINRDRDLRLQYLAGMGLNLNQSGAIFAELRSYRRFPEEIFPGSSVWNGIWRRTFAAGPPPSKEPSQELTAPTNHALHAVDAPAPVAPAIGSNSVQLRLRSNTVDQIKN